MASEWCSVGITGGVYGSMLREYDLGADSSYIIDVHGRILYRESMGEELFGQLEEVEEVVLESLLLLGK